MSFGSFLKKMAKARFNPVSAIAGWDKEHAPNAPLAPTAPDQDAQAAKERQAAARLAANRQGFASTILGGSSATTPGNALKAPQASVADKRTLDFGQMGNRLAWTLQQPTSRATGYEGATPYSGDNPFDERAGIDPSKRKTLMGA
jgi:hypothetical protein